MASDELNLRAYYFGFTPTGCLAVDKILAAVARAGKAAHHTQDWECDGVEVNHIERIQKAAQEAATIHEILHDQGPQPNDPHGVPKWLTPTHLAVRRYFEVLDRARKVKARAGSMGLDVHMQDLMESEAAARAVVGAPKAEV